MRLTFAWFALLLTACASSSTPPPPPVPAWEAIPAGIVEALCTRLQLDAVTSGQTLAIVRTTQPIATQTSVGALARGATRARQVPPPSNRMIPVDIAPGGGCSWKVVESVDPQTQFDQMVVELSAPIANPFAREAGILARVSLGGQHPAWYWIPLAPRGGGWSVGFVSVISN